MPESLVIFLFLVVFVVIRVDESPGEANEVSLIEMFLIFFLKLISSSSDEDDDDDEEAESLLRFSFIFSNDLPIMLLPLSRFLLPFSFVLTIVAELLLRFVLAFLGDESSELLDELDFLSFFSLTCSCVATFVLCEDFLALVDGSESDDDELLLDIGSCLTLA